MKYLSPNDIAVRLGISRSKVYRMLHDIPSVQLGKRCRRVLEVDLNAYVAGKKAKTTWEDSTDDTTKVTGTATTKSRKANDDSTASEPPIDPSPANDSDLPSWARRPIRAAKNKG